MNSPGPVHGLTVENLLTAFPIALQGDQSSVALADVTARLLARRPEEINRLLIYPAIARLDEKLLDILAYDFKVDWWDQEYSIEEKRRTLKGSWRVHKILGTKAAVETAIRAIYPLTTVEEWFEYGGEPYHFRLNIDITSDNGDRVRQRRVLERLNFYKNLRSHNDGVRFFLAPEKSWAVAGGVFAGSREVDRAEIIVPPLKRPGSAFITIAGGGFTGSWQRIDAGVDSPPLTRPQGTASKAASAGYIGSVERVTVKVNAGQIRVPTGRAATGGAAGMFHSYQRIRVSVRSPATTISGR